MRLTQQTSHAIRTLMWCATHRDAPSRIRDIAHAFGFSELHLFKIMRLLVDNGFIATSRGRNGGIRLARPAHDIRLGSVVRAMEGNFHLADCQNRSEQAACPLGGDGCRFGSVLDEALTAFFGVLDAYTIADVVARRSGLDRALGVEDAHPLLGAALPTDG